MSLVFIIMERVHNGISCSVRTWLTCTHTPSVIQIAHTECMCTLLMMVHGLLVCTVVNVEMKVSGLLQQQLKSLSYILSFTLWLILLCILGTSSSSGQEIADDRMCTFCMYKHTQYSCS